MSAGIKTMRPQNKRTCLFCVLIGQTKIMIFLNNTDFQLFCSFEFNQKQKEQTMGSVLDAQR